jgi:hypothetical protein
MRLRRLSSWIVFVGFLIWITGIGFVQSLLQEWHSANGLYHLQKMSVNDNAAKDIQGNAGLTMDDADSLDRLTGKKASFQARTLQNVLYKSNQSNAEIIGVSGPYDSFNQLWFQKGGMFSQKSVSEHSRVAVISGDFAEKMFHSQNVMNLTIQIWNQTFVIGGVYEQDATVLQAMADNGIPDIMIPLTVLMDFEPNRKISTIELTSTPDAYLHGEAVVSDALTAIGKSPSQYKIVNYLLEQKKLENKSQIPLLPIGIFSICVCLGVAVNQLRVAVRVFRQGMLTKDASDVWKEEWKRIAVHFLGSALAVGGIVLFWVLLRFPFYIPPDLIPVRLINLSFYKDWIDNYWHNQMNMLGYAASQHEVWLERLNLMANVIVGIILLIGIPLFTLGIRDWVTQQFSVPAVINRVCGYVLLSLLSGWAVAGWAGLAFQIDWRSLLLLLGFLLCSLQYFQNKNRKKGVT